MDIFSLLTLCGGLAFFLFGMHTMSKSLEKMAGGKLERTLRKMTSNPVKSLLLGAGITIAIQSSSAMTVMLVGLVNSGVMELGQTIGVIMGSNVGTTLTAWILSLSGLESNSVWIQLLKPENFSPAFALLGIILIMASKKPKRRDIGNILVGFSILMYGMELMKDAMAPLADMPEFETLLVAFNNPLLGVLLGTVFTGIIQSSAASVGILQALSLTGSLSFGVAIPIIMGQNIGTCVTALLSSIGVNRNAKRVAMVHISFNLIGTAVCLILFYGGNLLFHFAFLDYTIDAVGIAFCHTVFNLFTTAILFPFTRQLEKLACWAVKSEAKAQSFAFLDPRLLRTPTVAVNESTAMTNQMAQLTHKTLLMSLQQLWEYSPARETEILANEDKLDTYEDRLGSFLVEVSRHSMTGTTSREVSRLLRAINDFERIGDHALNIQESAQELRDKELNFSDAASKELRVLVAALTEIMERTFASFKDNDLQAAAHVEPMEETIDRLTEEMRLRHIERLQSGRCTIQLGFVLNDLLTNMERVSDHCSNVALCVIEAADNSIDPHAYVQELRTNGSGFADELRSDMSRYRLPKN